MVLTKSELPTVKHLKKIAIAVALIAVLIFIAVRGSLLPWQTVARSRVADLGASDERQRPAPVQTAPATRGDMDITIAALGTVTARNIVTVHSRVDGELTRIHFREGQRVKAGDSLADIDSRPFQVQLDQAVGQLARDQAQLENSERDQARYRQLLKEDSIAQQLVDTQEALVRQNRGIVLADQAQMANAKLQLIYAHIVAPIAGRLGLRQVDQGNIIHANDTNGLVVITETQPISAVFSIPADKLPDVAQRFGAGTTLTVDALDRQGSRRLARGRVVTLDNQIDTATGTLKLKAEFENQDDALFPNQFINVVLHVATLRNATLIPSAAVQQGADGEYVYVLTPEHTVTLRHLLIATQNQDQVAVASGVEPGERVVVDGVDKLREGAKVEDRSADSLPDSTRRAATLRGPCQRETATQPSG